MRSITILTVSFLLGAWSASAQTLEVAELDPGTAKPVELEISLEESDDAVSIEVYEAISVDSDRQLEDSDASMHGNVETEFKVEKGEKASDSDLDAIPDQMELELAGAASATTDEETSAVPIQYNETNLEFIRQRGNEVSVKAVEVRGWDPEKKRELLETVKEHAQVVSGQDLENFAAGVLLKDENIESAEIDEEKIEVGYTMPAKFLGLFSTRLTAKASVEKSADEEIMPDKYGRVKVKFPWYRFLYRVPKEVQSENLEQAIREGLDETAGEAIQNAAQQAARQFQVLSNIMKTKHDTAMNIIRNIK